MNTIKMSYAAFIYAQTVAAALPRKTFSIEYTLDHGAKKEIHCRSIHLPEGTYDLFKIHSQLESLKIFQRHSSEYEYISADQTLQVRLSEMKGEAQQSIIINNILSLHEDTDGSIQTESSHKIAEFARKGAVWSVSANMSSLQTNLHLLVKVAKILYQRTESGEFIYAAGGRSLEQTKVLLSIHSVLQQALLSWSAMEEAEKLVVPAGKEKNKKFSKKKRSDDGEEPHARHSEVVAEVSPEGSVTVSVVENFANEIDQLSYVSYHPDDAPASEQVTESTPEDKPN